MNLKFWQSKKTAKPVDDDDKSQYQIKAYSKDGGYIRSPGRKGKNQNSATYGGMGERELQLRLELLIEQALSSQRSVFQPAQALADFSLADQERFLASVDSLSYIDVELAYHFCHFATKSLRLIESEDWPAWIDHLLNINKQKGMDSAISTMQAVDDYVSANTAAPTSVSFSEIALVLERIITGLNGRGLKLEQGEELFCDTEVIHLPENIATFKQRDDNFALYKSMVVHQWAQTWYGTWRVDVQQLIAQLSDPQRALQLFHNLETVRLDANIMRELPGIGRELLKFNSLLNTQDLPSGWLSAIKELSAKDATAHDSARLLYQLYDLDYDPADTLYQGVLSPELAKQKLNERVEQDKESLNRLLNQLEKELSNQQETTTDEDTSEENKRFEVREQQDDEMPDGYRLELDYDGEAVDAPEEVQQLLDSLQQDLGEIPDDFLNDGGMLHSSDEAEEKDDLDNSLDTDNVFLYDEWDHSRQKYRKEWCQLREIEVSSKPSTFVEDTLNKHRGLLKSLHRTFESLRDDNRRLKKQPYGEDLDIDAVIASYADIVNGVEVDENLFIKQRKVDRNIAVMFMVDMSGSTSGWINEMEREALVLLCESLEILGDRYAIYGFSGITHRQCDLYKIKEFDEAYTTTVKNRIASMGPKDYTRMGAAIRHLSKLLSRVEAKTKVLITLSDGRPDDRDGYRGTYGIEDTRRALIEAKYLGIHPFCITIDEEAMDYLQHMYGPVNFTIVDQVDKLPYKVSDIYRRITM